VSRSTSRRRSLVAALIHLWVVPGHAWIWWGYGVFFLATALAQGLLGVALLRWPVAPLAVAGICGNLAVVLLYVFTRTSGVPIGPHTKYVCIMMHYAEDLKDSSASGPERVGKLLPKGPRSCQA
jgi:hypothetical protein